MKENNSPRDTSKLMPPISLSLSMISEADGGCMAEEAEPSHQCSIIFCCRVTDSRRERLWQNGIWGGSAYEAQVSHWIPPCGKKYHPLKFIDTCWRVDLWKLNNGCEHSEAVGGAFQQWHERQATFRSVMHSRHTTEWSVCWLSLSCELTDCNQGTVYGAE